MNNPGFSLLDHPLGRRPFPFRALGWELLLLPFLLQDYACLRSREYRPLLTNHPSLEKSLRLPEMFIAGGLAASLAARYLQGGRRSLPGSWGYARLFSRWANYLILADAASDHRELEAAASRTFLLAALREIFTPLVPGDERRSTPTAPLTADDAVGSWLTSPLATTALRLARLFGREAAACLAAHGDSQAASRSFALFTQRMLTLLKGQFASLKQRRRDGRRGWAWYRREVLDAKFTNVLFAPLALMSTDPEQSRRREVLEQGLQLVNALYLHRQLLDDLTDMENDCREGIRGAPAYLLLAVGRRTFPPAPPETDESDFLAALPQVLARHLAARGPGALAQEAAARRAFLQAWERRPGEAAHILRSSLTVQVLLQIMGDPSRLEPLHRQLNALLAQEPRAAAPLHYYHYRCARTFRKMAASLPRG